MLDIKRHGGPCSNPGSWWLGTFCSPARSLQSHSPAPLQPAASGAVQHVCYCLSLAEDLDMGEELMLSASELLASRTFQVQCDTGRQEGPASAPPGMRLPSS